VQWAHYLPTAVGPAIAKWRTGMRAQGSESEYFGSSFEQANFFHVRIRFGNFVFYQAVGR
jgi:hypothetical protein